MVSGYDKNPPDPSGQPQLGAGAIWLMIGVGALLAFGAFGYSPRFDRESMESSWGRSVADFFHGECDLRFRAFVRKDRTMIGATEQVSERFLRGAVTTRIYPILKEEEAHVIFAIERAFAWDSSNVPFKVWRRENGDVTFQPAGPIGMDGITLDECGYLIGDDYPQRQRQAAFLKGREQ